MGARFIEPVENKDEVDESTPTSIRIIKLNLTKYFLQHTKENCKGKYRYENRFCKNAWVGK